VGDDGDWDRLIEQAEKAAAPAPPGIYPMQVTSAMAGKSAAGNRMWTLVSQIAEGEWAGRQVWHHLSIAVDNDTSLQLFFQAMEHMGLSLDYFRKRPRDEQVATDLVGRRFKASLGAEEYNGTTRNVLRRYYPGS
jgi:hypothetical protein